MAYSRAEEFGDEDIRMAKVAKALSHPARVAIVRLLARRGACICGDIVEQLPLSQATVSQHLKELKDAGIISGETDGPRVCYCLNTQACRRAVKTLGSFCCVFENCKC